MSSNTNNFLPRHGTRAPPGPESSNSHAPGRTSRNHRRVSSFPRSQPTLDINRGRHDPWHALDETLIPRIPGLASFFDWESPLPPIQILVINSGRTRPRESPPRLIGHGNLQPSTSVQEDDSSSLTQQEQLNALKKLKKEIYNPVPKKTTNRLSLYYRERAMGAAKERAKEKEEEGKRCAICLEDFEAKEVVMVTPCGHMFHEECIVPWVKSRGQCPVCRFGLCERTRDSAPLSLDSHGIDNVARNDLPLITTLRALEEALAWANSDRPRV